MRALELRRTRPRVGERVYALVQVAEAPCALPQGRRLGNICVEV